MKNFPKLTRLSLSTYPTWWQERYRDEMNAVIDGLLEEGRSSLRIDFNLLGGSLRARLLGTGAPASQKLWSRRTQTSLLVATLPWFVMIPLMGVFAGNDGQYGFFHGSVRIQMSRAGDVARDLNSVVFDLLIASVIVVLFGWSRLRAALEQRQKGKWFARVPFVAAMGGIALILVVLPFGQHAAVATSCARIGGSTYSSGCLTATHGFTMTRVLALSGLAFIAVAFVLTPIVIARAVSANDLPVKSLRSGSRIATVLSTLFVGMTLVVATYGVAASLQPTPKEGMSYLLERSSLGGWFVLLVLGLFTMAVVSSLGAIAARRSYRRTIAL